MHSLKIDVEDSIYSHIISFLKTINKDQINIIEDKKIDIPKNTKNSIEKLFKNKKCKPFSSIDDPLKWQKEQREEW